ncbi:MULTISPECIES: FMN-dependent NADH-azoreductase [Xanthomonas]|uniref:FMN dependent NADH:quinone oxidoreductase n=3 Tax=Gammaproteobacteria TaxID=1236 RepID=A0A7Z7NIB3_XANCH|nr:MULTISPECIES: FMN-dependent NADH-azoreductase [Xanthomonas]ATS38662.1 FMN-dependent NADH-azoreductase [Xanthomonas citri pv. phaseoli var. fuscans]ATS42536.1 FMN-dependent NADH-azoreductase [Xanthomonas citri pv. phaseoli var. fuscans]ATS46662.1 FMN-dependent NADH-azoreductase [Xanthomonas citri pv. phaseoli var. fuscans]ATS83078.1 FMN-dependent NADH-azoreductase [Xanthomonas citri pv. phaseoli var. fuscans]QWN20315.1 FMN-dependent NADH-azoreductase [Xanthomonas citri]
MKLLHLDSSALGANSISRVLSAAVVEQQRRLHPEVDVSYRDLDRDPIPHLTAQTLAQADPAEAAAAEAVMQQFLQADVIVIGAPMYNFAIPSTLKAWIDRIAVAGRTFQYTANGPEGLAGGKRVIIASARGGLYADPTNDFQEPYLRQVFGFLGIDDIRFVRAEGVAYSPQHRADALASALAGLGEEEEVAVSA